MLRQLDLEDMDAAARVLRTAFDQALPWLAGLHTPAQDRWFFRERVFATCEVWGAFDGAVMVGMLAFREDWIDQLYVLPEAQGRGVGTELLQVAQNAFDRLQLWTFQRNDRALRFYRLPATRQVGPAGQGNRIPPTLIQPSSVLSAGERRPGNIEMDREKLAGILGAIVAAIVLVIAIAYGPIGQMGKPQKQIQKVEPTKAPANAPPAVRGPVIREVPQ
jgi:GNAT superfamily N-acetyltransferase